MLLAAHPAGRVAIGQPAHAWMCGQLARAWGNERFGAVEPAEEVCLAAEQHDMSWADWDLAPTLDPAVGLPQTVNGIPLTARLDLYTIAPRRLLMQSRYAALLMSLHRSSFFEAPSTLGRLREEGRRIEIFLQQASAFQAEVRATLDVPDEEIDRNWRLVRTWDTLSLDLIVNRVPRTRTDVPAAGGDAVDLVLARSGDTYTVDPWPFKDERVVVRTEGRLLEGTFNEERAMREALAHAPWLELRYELAPAITSG